ncbi:hypothetical protein, partial [Phyllobacterium sp. SB3]|uniref:hypothetical protein n=1 Tax=Phyllobacterium sp. SB3 TaxID=3156073 RepID=UPI0032AF5F63
LYTDTTRAGRRWRLPNAPISQAVLLTAIVDGIRERFDVSLCGLGSDAWFVFPVLLVGFVPDWWGWVDIWAVI